MKKFINRREGVVEGMMQGMAVLHSKTACIQVGLDKN
jgi:hypothetical protein